LEKQGNEVIDRYNHHVTKKDIPEEELSRQFNKASSQITNDFHTLSSAKKMHTDNLRISAKHEAHHLKDLKDYKHGKLAGRVGLGAAATTQGYNLYDKNK
jgi:hypothetical protein